MDHVYFVNINQKKRTARCLVYLHHFYLLFPSPSAPYTFFLLPSPLIHYSFLFDLHQRHYTKYTAMPSFIGEICKPLSVGNIVRSSRNFTQLVSDMAIPENSYVMFDVVVKASPEVYFFIPSPSSLPLHPSYCCLHYIEGVCFCSSRRLHGFCWKSKGTMRVSYYNFILFHHSPLSIPLPCYFFGTTSTQYKVHMLSKRERLATK